MDLFPHHVDMLGKKRATELKALLIFILKTSVCVRERQSKSIHYLSFFTCDPKNMIPRVLLKTHEHSAVLTVGGAFGGLI